MRSSLPSSSGHEVRFVVPGKLFDQARTFCSVGLAASGGLSGFVSLNIRGSAPAGRLRRAPAGHLGLAPAGRPVLLRPPLCRLSTGMRGAQKPIARTSSAPLPSYSWETVFECHVPQGIIRHETGHLGVGPGAQSGSVRPPRSHGEAPCGRRGSACRRGSAASYMPPRPGGFGAPPGGGPPLPARRTVMSESIGRFPTHAMARRSIGCTCSWVRLA